MYCTQCGNELKEGAAFCTQCGAKVNDVVSVSGAAQKTNVKKDFHFFSKRNIVIVAIAVILTVAVVLSLKIVSIIINDRGNNSETDKGAEKAAQLTDINNPETEKSTETATYLTEIDDFEAKMNDAIANFYSFFNIDHEGYFVKNYSITNTEPENSDFSHIAFGNYGPNNTVMLIAWAEEGTVTKVNTSLLSSGLDSNDTSLVKSLYYMLMIPVTIFNAEYYDNPLEIETLFQEIIEKGISEPKDDGWDISYTQNGLQYEISYSSLLISFTISKTSESELGHSVEKERMPSSSSPSSALPTETTAPLEDGAIPTEQFLIESGATGALHLYDGYYEDGILYVDDYGTMEPAEEAFGEFYRIMPYEPEAIEVEDHLGETFKITACYIEDRECYYVYGGRAYDSEWIALCDHFLSGYTVTKGTFPDSWYPPENAILDPVGTWKCVGYFDCYGPFQNEYDAFKDGQTTPIPEEYLTHISDGELGLKIDRDTFNIISGGEVTDSRSWFLEFEEICVESNEYDMSYGYYMIDNNTIHEFYSDWAIYVYTRD